MPGTSTICGACLADLERALGSAGALAAELQVTFARQARLGSGAGRRSAERPLPYDGRASRLALRLRTELVGWARVLAEHAPEPLPGPVCVACRHRSCRAIRKTRMPADTIGATAAWLLLHLDEIRQHEAAAEMVANITALTRSAERLIDRPADRVYSGPCDVCGDDLFGRLDAAEVACRGCGARYDVAARRQWLLAEAEDVLAGAALISRALTRLGSEVRVERVRQWASRGQLAAHGVDANGRPLYRVGDVIDLLERMTLKAAS
jgi:hypothetical protein